MVSMLCSSVVSDAELSGQVQSDPGSFSSEHPHGGGATTVDNSADNLSEPSESSQVPHMLLSVCGGLGDDGELSHGTSEGEGIILVCGASQGLQAHLCAH